MNVSIALDTSTRSPSIAARAGAQLIEIDLEPERAHASDLLPACVQALEELEVPPAAIRLIGVGLGPGSFTGLRVGVATALGLARATGARLVGAPSGPIIARRELKPGEQVLQVQDARGGAFYIAHFARDDAGRVHTVTAACLATADAVGEALNALPSDALLWADAGARKLLEARDWTGHAVSGDPHPRAATLLEIAAERAETGNWTLPEALEPLYLRPFAARVRRR